MKLRELQVFDPPMCCSSGVCGPNVDPALVRFSRDLDWLRKQGVEVKRLNLSSNPVAFAGQECVREALTRDGTECLPLVLADGAIVSRGAYPSRSELIGFAGLGEAAKDEQLADAAAASSHAPASGTTLCGPGCDCGVSPKGSRAVKTAIILLVVLAVAGILIYKVANAKQTASSGVAAGPASSFAGGQAALGITTQPSGGMGNGGVVAGAASEADAGRTTGGTWEHLKSLGDLNEVALSQDAVFILVPAAQDEPVPDQTNAAVLAAQKTLKANNIALGLYTLAAGSPEYAAISRQVQTPAILVASKGRGMAAVSGEVTESKLIQAFVASSSAGGCCPSSSATCP